MAKYLTPRKRQDSNLVDAEPEMPLLYALRNDLQLNGPKFGCGLAQCGACTVIMDGVAIRSCVTPVGTVQNKAITTLEGLGNTKKMHKTPAGLRRRASRAVRLLHQRHDHDDAKPCSIRIPSRPMHRSRKPWRGISAAAAPM